MFTTNADLQSVMETLLKLSYRKSKIYSELKIFKMYKYSAIFTYT